jgi:ribose transport system substrate-binding protein
MRGKKYQLRGIRVGVISALVLASTASVATASEKSHSTGAVNIAHATSLINENTSVPKFVAPGPAFKASAAKGKKVFIIPVSSAVPFNVYFGQALTAALGKFNVKTTYFSDTGQTSQWVAGINTAIAQKVNAIALIDVDPKAIQPQIAAAKKAGIAVFDAHFLDASHPYASGYKNLKAWNSAPYRLAGQLEAAWAIKQTHGKGTFITINSPDLLSATDVNLGIYQEFKADCPACKVITINVPFNDWSTRMQSTLASALVANPNTSYVLPVFDFMVEYAMPAIVAAGKTKTVHIATYNADPGPLTNLRQNDVVTFDVGESFSWLGYAMADQVLRSLSGVPTLANEQAPVRAFWSGNVAETGNPPKVNVGYGNAFVAGYAKLWGLK